MLHKKQFRSLGDWSSYILQLVNSHTTRSLSFAMIIFSSVVLLLILLSLRGQINAFVSYLSALSAYPYAWAMTENENMLFIQGLVDGSNVYANSPTHTAFYFVYTPLFHLVSAVASLLLGYTIAIPRLISLAALVSIGIMILRHRDCALSRTENLLLTSVLVAIGVGASQYSRYYPLARADLPACALGIASVYYCWKIHSSQTMSKLNYWLCGGLALASLLTKQSILFPLILIALCLASAVDKKKWLSFLLLVGAACLFAFLLLQWITNNEFGRSLAMAKDIYGQFLYSAEYRNMIQASFKLHWSYLLWTIPLGLMMSISDYLKNKSERALAYNSIVPLYALSLYLNFMIVGGNQGAGLNSLIPQLFGLLLIVKDIYASSVNILPSISRVTILLLLALQVQSILASGEARDYPTPSSADRDNQAELVKELTTSRSDFILGDRIDHAIQLSGHRSAIEASTHNVALTAPGTATLAKEHQVQLQDNIKSGKISLAVTTVTKFGEQELYQTIKDYSRHQSTLIIDYMDVASVKHELFYLDK